MRPGSLSGTQLGGLASPSGTRHARVYLPHAPVLGGRGLRWFHCCRLQCGFPPQHGRSVCQHAIGRCWCCSSRIWSYGSLKRSKSRLFVLAETNRVVLTSRKDEMKRYEPVPENRLTLLQETSLSAICERYHVAYHPIHYRPSFH